MNRIIVLILLVSSVVFSREAADYSDQELISAGWTQEQIDILKGRSQSREEERQERIAKVGRDFDQANRNCLDESKQVLGAERTNEDTMSYWIACVESFGFNNAREVALETVASKYVTKNNVHADTGKPFSMLVRERANFEYEYCTAPLLGASDIADYHVSEAVACLRDFLWFEDQIEELKTGFIQLK